MDALIDSFRRKLFSLIPDLPNSTLIAAVSGGKDSIALLTLLKSLESDLGFTLKAAYFNHQLREDSSQEEAWVINFCAVRSIPLIRGGARVARYAEENRMNLEEAASRLRYAFLESHTDDSPGTWILTGHTASDLSETFLMHLFRGSGSQGLSAIYPSKDARIIRPLLDFTEPDIRAYLKRNNIPHFSDSSNLNDQFLRNRMRHKLLPPLRSEFPHLDRKISDTSNLLREEADFLSELARQTLTGIMVQENILQWSRLHTFHPALQRHLLREYVRLIRGDLRGISMAHIESLRLPQSPCRTLSIPGITFALRKGFLFPASLMIRDYQYPLPAAGVVDIPEISARVIVGGDRLSASLEDISDSVILNTTRLPLPLHVRAPRKSDRYRAANSNVSKRIFEMIRVAGLPAPLRALRPIFCDASDRPLWLPGYPPASHAHQVKHNGLNISVAGIWTG